MSERFSVSASPSARRAPRIDAELEALRGQRPSGRSSGEARMGIFSRTRDILAASFADLLDRADDPARTIRTMIAEMEQVLGEVRASAARAIADRKELERHRAQLVRLQEDWTAKAQLALAKGREDLARAALIEKRKANDLAAQLAAESGVLEQAVRAYEDDLARLQSRLAEARGRQATIAARLESAEQRIKLRGLLAGERVDEALARFEELERRVDQEEGRADALALGRRERPAGVAAELAALGDGDDIEAELAGMKRALPGAGDQEA